MLTLWAAMVAAAEPKVEPIAEGAFRLTLEAAPGAIRDAQAAMSPAARRACATAMPVFGRFRYNLGGTAGAPASLDQELICLPAGQVPLPAAAAADSAWSPDAVLQGRLLAASYGYFAAKDQGRFADAHRLLSPHQQAASPLPDWTAAAAEFNAEAGPVRGRRIVEVSWYNHPPDAPEPGIYVAADYSAEFDGLEFVCGYLMWRLQPDGSFRLAREEQNFVRKRERPIVAIDRDPMRVRMGCKD